MKPYLTILLDSFRMLKARTIFWVTLGISLLVALIYLSIGFDEKGMSLFFGLSHFESDMFRRGTPQSETLYVAIFTKLIAEYWLSWIAVLLALVSCAAIFPEALQEGASGVVLTKKLSRFQVFVAKFVGSLLFVTLQVTLFVVIVFVALRWRVGSWNPSIFWYVPLILLVFTYLYSFMVVIAVKTKSVMTALILTLVLWAVSSFVGFIEGQIYSAIKMTERMEDSGKRMDVEARSAQTEESEGEEALPSEEPEMKLEQEEYRSSSDANSMKTWHQRIVAAYALFPKTGRTMEIADRLLVVNGEKGSSKGTFMTIMMGMEMEEHDQGMSEEFVRVGEESADRHSKTYAIGTSVAFSVVMLALSAWIFCRKEI